MGRVKKDKKSKVSKTDVISREYTINLHKRLFGETFNTRAPKAVRAVKNFARKEFHTSDVRLDVNLNKFLWSSGIRNVPKRVRVRITRLRNEDEEAKEKMYSLVTLVPVTDFKGLQTINVDVSE